MPVLLNVQREISVADLLKQIPDDDDLQHWAQAAQLDGKQHLELTLRVVDTAEIQTLNRVFRHKDQTTNVLSFASDVPPGSGIDILGDIVICAEIVAQEAEKYGKDLNHRWAHMLVHACLHVQGLDHEQENERANMEAEEIRILNALGIPDPYQLN
ncbi:MAG: rRNA maturation RNase YbeY [Gammaproteobacteria bacterium]|nr:rRNA maturation RNase YbeY [Gammaproteobacteria bacterium]